MLYKLTKNYKIQYNNNNMYLNKLSKIRIILNYTELIKISV
jgi:hypothetical protein